jgi:hypothetical protein
VIPFKSIAKTIMVKLKQYQTYPAQSREPEKKYSHRNIFEHLKNWQTKSNIDNKFHD